MIVNANVSASKVLLYLYFVPVWTQKHSFFMQEKMNVFGFKQVQSTGTGTNTGSNRYRYKRVQRSNPPKIYAQLRVNCVAWRFYA